MTKFLFFALSLAFILMAAPAAAQRVAQDVTSGKEVVTASATASVEFSMLVCKFASEGNNPVVMEISGVGPDGRAIMKYSYKGNWLPVASAVATPTGEKMRPIRLDVVAGEGSAVRWELYFSETFGGQLKGTVAYGDRLGSNTLYCQKKK